MVDWTNYSNLARLQINVDTILFPNMQFDSLFNATHTVIGVTRANVQLPHSPITWPFQTQDEFCSKIVKVRNLFAFNTSRKFTLLHNTAQQHYFTENGKKEEKNLWHTDTLSDLIKSHFYLVPHSLQRTFVQFSYLLPLQISD